MARPQFNFTPPPSSPFEKVPQEIRDLIYNSLLVQPWPIVVWAGETESTGRSLRPGLWNHHRLKTSDSVTVSSRRGLSTDILYCNASISLEACAILYGRNTFVFQGDHDWMPVIRWLDCIGVCNSSLIRKLEISVLQPTLSWQFSNGSRRYFIIAVSDLQTVGLETDTSAVQLHRFLKA